MYSKRRRGSFEDSDSLPRSALQLGPTSSQESKRVEMARYVRGLCFSLVGLYMTASTALALPLLTSPQVASFNSTVSVTDTKATAGATSQNNALFTPSVVSNRYNGPDILTGVNIQLNSTRTPTGTVSGSGGGLPRNATGSGSSTGQINVPGASQAFGSISVSPNCSRTSSPANCTSTVTGSAQAANATFHLTTGLSNYYGAGTFSATRTDPTLTALAGGTFNNVTFTYQEAWAGTLTTTYEYIKHANGSFDGTSDVNALTLDFGTVLQGSIAQQSFSLFNLIDPAGATAGLDFDSINGVGDTSAFLLSSLSPFTNLAAGHQQNYSVALDTNQSGSYSATYFLSLSDEDVGIGGSSSILELTLRGTVTTVPEPATWLLLLTGCVALVGFHRHRSSQAAA